MQFLPQAAMMAVDMIGDQQAQNAQNKAVQAQAGQAAAAYDRQLQEIAKRQEIEERQRKERLRQVQAAQRARFGGSGLSSAGGSADALLKGLESQSAREAADRLSLQQFGVDDINRRRADLLEQAKPARKSPWDMLSTVNKFVSLLDK